MKKPLLLIVLLALLLSTGIVTTYLLSRGEEQTDFTIGEVSVNVRVYYENNGQLIEAQSVVIDPDLQITKQGVFHINVTDSSALEYIENIRIYIDVYSNVDTYLRVKLIEQMTLTTINHHGDKTEIAILTTEPIELNFSEDDWYFSNELDDYYYYKSKVKHIDEDNPLEIGLITSYFSDRYYSAKPLGYSLQLGIRVQAVQAIQGPQNNWNLDNPPWGGQW